MAIFYMSESFLINCVMSGTNWGPPKSRKDVLMRNSYVCNYEDYVVEVKAIKRNTANFKPVMGKRKLCENR